MSDVCMIRYESVHEACPRVFFFTFYIVWNLFQLIPDLLLFLDSLHGHHIFPSLKFGCRQAKAINSSKPLKNSFVYASQLGRSLLYIHSRSVDISILSLTKAYMW